MTKNLDANKLSLKDVRRTLKVEERLNEAFASLLSLEDLTEFEEQELQEIRLFWVSGEYCIMGYC